MCAPMSPPGVGEAAGRHEPAVFSFLGGHRTLRARFFGIAAMPAFFSSSLLIHITIDEEFEGKREQCRPWEVE